MSVFFILNLIKEASQIPPVAGYKYADLKRNHVLILDKRGEMKC